MLAAVSGGLSAMVMVFVVAGTLSLSTQQRQRELALLRAIGTTPRQLRRMVLGEALVVGLLAVGAAVVLGPVLGNWLFDQLAANHVVPDVLRFEQGWLPATVAAGASLLAVIAASFVAGRRASKVRPTEALAEAAVERRWLTPIRLITAILCFAGGTALAIVTVAVMTGPVAASTAGPAVMLWAFGLAAISPGVTKVMAMLLRWPVQAISGVTGRVALLNTRVGAVRTAGAVTPIMLAVGIATANIYLQTTQEAVSNQAYTEDLRADAVVAGPGGLDPSVLGRVAAMPGVAGASEYVTSTVFIEKPYDSNQDDDGWPALGVSELTGNAVEVPDEARPPRRRHAVAAARRRHAGGRAGGRGREPACRVRTARAARVAAGSAHDARARPAAAGAGRSRRRHGDADFAASRGDSRVAGVSR